MSIKTGDRLKDLRKKHNFTQRDISNFLNISQSLIAKIESNERNLNLTKVLKLCDLYNVSAEYILYEIQTNNKEKSKYNDYNMLSAMSVANGIYMHRLTHQMHGKSYSIEKLVEELKQKRENLQIVTKPPKNLLGNFKRPETEFLDETR